MKNATLRVWIGVPTPEEAYHMTRKYRIVKELTPDLKLRAAYYHTGPPQLSAVEIHDQKV